MKPLCAPRLPEGPARQAGPTQERSLRRASQTFISGTARPRANNQAGGLTGRTIIPKDPSTVARRFARPGSMVTETSLRKVTAGAESALGTVGRLFREVVETRSKGRGFFADECRESTEGFGGEGPRPVDCHDPITLMRRVRLAVVAGPVAGVFSSGPTRCFRGAGPTLRDTHFETVLPSCAGGAS